MGIMDRVATVIKSNLNHLINKAEDPEKMLDQILIQMRQQLVEAKREVAVAIADEKRLAAAENGLQLRSRSPVSLRRTEKRTSQSPGFLRPCLGQRARLGAHGVGGW